MSPDVPKGLWQPGRGSEDTRALYRDWAARYDTDMAEGGYVGPTRAAEMFARFVPMDAPVLDFGCGTGLSGVALRRAGFTRLDGTDISPEMLEKARASGAYDTIYEGEPGQIEDLRSYLGVMASGVVSIGAGPAELLPALLDRMAPEAMLVFSYNQDTLRDPAYMNALTDVQVLGTARLEAAEHGPQLPKLGRTATIFALRRL